MTYYMRMPGPGEMRGEGTWTLINEQSKAMTEQWEHCRRTGYLPVAMTYKMPNKVQERERPGVEPNFLLVNDNEGRWLIHQFHELGIPLHAPDDRHLRYAHDQLKALIKTVVDG
jgi:hypothetical protein